MSDHYHYASDIQGVADDRHSHSDLERDVQYVESDVRELKREVGILRSELDDARQRIAELERQESAR